MGCGSYTNLFWSFAWHLSPPVQVAANALLKPAAKPKAKKQKKNKKDKWVAHGEAIQFWSFSKRLQEL